MTLFGLLETDQFGTYHMVCKDFGTRLDVAREIVDICGYTDEIQLEEVSSDFFNKEFYAPNGLIVVSTHPEHFDDFESTLAHEWKHHHQEHL